MKTTTITISGKPILAAVFNAILPGAGYLFAGVRKKFAWLLLSGVVLSIVAMFDPQSLWYFGNEQSPAMTVLETISALVILAAFAYDAYVEANKVT